MTENNTHLNTGYPNPGAYHMTPTPQKKQPAWKKPIVWLPIVAAVVAFGLGSGTATAQTIEVEKVVEKRVDVPGPERIVTKTVTQDVTPAECKTYITLSEQAFDISAEAMGRAARLDAAGVNAQTAKLKAISPDLLAAKSACRSK